LWTRVEQLRETLSVSEVGGRETKQLSLAAAGGGQHDAGGFFNPSFNGSPGVRAQVVHTNSSCGDAAESAGKRRPSFFA